MSAAVQPTPSGTRCYQRRHPEHTLWYRAAQAHFETWLALAAGPDDTAPPAYVEQGCPQSWRGLDVASLEDIAAMKLTAVLGRGSKKDFIDLYELCQRPGLDRVMKTAERKFPLHADFPCMTHLAVQYRAMTRIVYAPSPPRQVELLSCFVHHIGTTLACISLRAKRLFFTSSSSMIPPCQQFAESPALTAYSSSALIATNPGMFMSNGSAKCASSGWNRSCWQVITVFRRWNSMGSVGC